MCKCDIAVDTRYCIRCLPSKIPAEDEYTITFNDGSEGITSSHPHPLPEVINFKEYDYCKIVIYQTKYCLLTNDDKLINYYSDEKLAEEVATDYDIKQRFK